jgi:hypothetical protein
VDFRGSTNGSDWRISFDTAEETLRKDSSTRPNEPGPQATRSLKPRELSKSDETKHRSIPDASEKAAAVSLPEHTWESQVAMMFS